LFLHLVDIRSQTTTVWHWKSARTGQLRRGWMFVREQQGAGDAVATASPSTTSFYTEHSTTSAFTWFVPTSVWHSPFGHFRLPNNFPHHLGHFSRLDVKAKIWKLALILTPDPNRSTAISFVHVNGRSLYIVDRCMVVVEEMEMCYTM